jgi:hypothetical protein
MTCVIATVNDRMAVRNNTGAGFRIAVFDVTDVAAGNYANRLADVAQPSGLGTFQGYALYGRYADLLTGEAYGEANPEPGNTYVHSLDLNSGALVQSFLTGAGSTLTHREPEGVALYRTAAASGAEGDRRSNLFYKNAL